MFQKLKSKQLQRDGIIDKMREICKYEINNYFQESNEQINPKHLFSFALFKALHKLLNILKKYEGKEKRELHENSRLSKTTEKLLFPLKHLEELREFYRYECKSLAIRHYPINPNNITQVCSPSDGIEIQQLKSNIYKIILDIGNWIRKIDEGKTNTNDIRKIIKFSKCKTNIITLLKIVLEDYLSCGHLLPKEICIIYLYIYISM